MQSFIVLGIIPGTNIQTDLNFWIGVTILFTLFLSRYRFYATFRALHIRFIAWRISQAVSHFDLISL